MLHAIKILQNADFGFLKLERNLKESHCHCFLATSRIKVPQDAQHKHRVCFCLGSQSPESTYKQGSSVETNPGSKTVMCWRFPVLTSIRGHGCLINIDVRWAMQIRSSAQTRSKASQIWHIPNTLFQATFFAAATTKKVWHTIDMRCKLLCKKTELYRGIHMGT